MGGNYGAALAGYFFGTALITWLLSRLWWWLLKRWDGGNWRVVAVHLATLLTVITIRSFGDMDGREYSWVRGITMAAIVFQFIWCGLDYFNGRGDYENYDDPPADDLAETFR